MKSTYPLLNHVQELFDEEPLRRVLFISCQHLLGTQYVMFQKLIALGVNPDDCYLIGKNYSSNEQVYHQLIDLGIHVSKASIQYDPLRSFDEWFAEKLREFLSNIYLHKDVTSYERIVILDDGGLLIHEVSKLDWPMDRISAIEQTSSGWSRLKHTALPFDVFYVARTHAKLCYETPFISKLCFERMMKHINLRGMINPRILIIGNQGVVGKSFQTRCRAEELAAVGFDIKQGDSFDNLIRPQLASFDVIVGTTGSNSFDDLLIQETKPTVSLISVSSSDREFPIGSFRKPDTSLHQDHFLGERCLVNSGFPITFYGNYHELSPRLIEITCSLLLLGVLIATLPLHDPRRTAIWKALIITRLSTLYFEQLDNHDYQYH